MRKFRFNSGSFQESMKIEIIIESLNELEKIISDMYDFKSFKIELDYIQFDYQGFDDRNKWDTYLVIVNLKDNNTSFPKSFPVGYSNFNIF